VVALLGAGVLASGCAQPDAPAAEADDPGVVHVHGLAADPEDPTVVLAATHTGLFRVEEDGKAQRVGTGWHDLMGFTVAPDGTFYASGHPDLQTEALRDPIGDPHLGLVRSTDRGRTWEPVSLLGEVDFHALTLADDALIGADATTGRVLASEDGGESWQERSRLPLVALAAHPADPELLVGSSSEGLVRSADGGRTWRQLADVEPGYLTADEAGFVVAQAQGLIAVSEDGREWRAVGTLPGPPEALAGGPAGALLAAATDVGLLRSDDGGRSWQLLHDADGA
jgi:hypothetical protein